MTAIQRPDLLRKNLYIPAINSDNGKSAFLLLDVPVPYQAHEDVESQVIVTVGDENFIVEKIDLEFIN